MKALLASIFLVAASSFAAAAPTSLLKTDASGAVTGGSYEALAKAVTAGNAIRIVYLRANRVFNRPCSSVAVNGDMDRVHCFVVDVVDTDSEMLFPPSQAFETLIVTSDGQRQIVKFDPAGKQIPFEGGACDGMAICTDSIAVEWFAE